MRYIWRYILILAALVILWNQIIVRPLRIISLFFHKIGHALAALIFGFGGSAFSDTFGSSGDTVVASKGWVASFIIANSGYVSSILLSMLILFLSRTSAKKYLLGSITIIYLLISVGYSSFQGALVTSIIFAVFTILLLMVQIERINELLTDIIGISSVAYVIHDTFVDTILLKLNQQLTVIKSWGTQPPADIIRLSEITRLPALVWGGIWLVIAVVSVNAVLYKSGGKKRR